MNSTETTTNQPASGRKKDFDVVVIGAGFAGLYMMHKLRELGFSAQVVETGDGVGGTWYWNRYPGARVDVESIEYSFSFSRDVEQEWTWSELMPEQAEIERYINFVTDRLDLRRHIKFNTRVTAATYDEASATWQVETDKGDRWTAHFVVTAVGCLSAPLEPAIEGLKDFKGVKLYTNRFPKEGFDFTGKRVAVVGTGSSGVQTIPVIAKQAAHLTVFQRSAAYTRPANNRALKPGELDELKADYGNIRARQLNAFAGALRFGAVSLEAPTTQKILETPMEERLKRLNDLGWAAPALWADVMLDMKANDAARELYGMLVRRAVKDPEKAESLIPHYPMGCKRQILDTDYFATFNRDNVDLVDLRKDAIKRITEDGVETGKRSFEFDVIVFATGFDAMTGALNRIDIAGRGGRRMRDAWVAEGPRTYLGVQVHGYPNLFTITGPGSPSVHSNMIVSIEQHVRWIGDCLVYLRKNGVKSIEANEDAQEAWVARTASIVVGRVNVSDSCNSWYLGANVPGKKRVYMPYDAGVPTYRKECEEIAQGGYEGFTLRPGVPHRHPPHHDSPQLRPDDVSRVADLP